jgi:hypothetical protein
MIELAEGIFIAPEHVTMIKSTGENECLLYFVGEDALGGHVLPYSASEVSEVVNDALYGEEDEVDEDETEEDE